MPSRTRTRPGSWNGPVPSAGDAPSSAYRRLAASAPRATPSCPAACSPPPAPHAEPAQDPSRLLEWSGPVGGERAVQLLPPYRGDDSEVTSKLPSDVLTVGESMYLQVWAINGFPNLVRTELWKSTDKGATWSDTGVTWDRQFAGGNFWLWSWDLHEDGYAYIYSSQYRDGYTPEGQGGSDLFLWRVPHDRIEDKSAYESWGWAEESGWQWGQPISPILVSPRRDNGL